MHCQGQSGMEHLHEKGKTSVLGTLKDQFVTVKSQRSVLLEHYFRVLKCQFGFRKVRLKCLKKNTA